MNGTFAELLAGTRLVQNLSVAGSFASQYSPDVLGGYAQLSSPKLRSAGQLTYNCELCGPSFSMMLTGKDLVKGH